MIDIEIGNDVILGAQSGVIRSVPEKSYQFGYPSRDHLLMKKIEAYLTRLPELFKRVRRLESSDNKD